MPIENLSGVLRMPRLGKIRLGEQAVTEKGKTYPKALDYFKVEEDGGITSCEAVEAFREVYGDKPKVLEVMFPTEDPEAFFPQYYTAYGKKRGKLCQGDGKTAKRWDGEGKERQLIDISCPGESCDWYLSKSCRRLATLQLILPKVPGLGVWHISTTSRNTIININSGIRLISQLTGGRLSFIPLKLRLKEIEVQGPEGFLIKVHVLSLANEDIRFQDILQAMNTTPIKALLPDPKEDPRPVDLYPDAVVEDEPKSEATPPTTADNMAANAAGSKAPKNSGESPPVESVPYKEIVKIVAMPNGKGKRLNVAGKDDKGELILLCESESILKNSFLALKPEDYISVTGQLRKNGMRYVMVEGLELSEF